MTERSFLAAAQRGATDAPPATYQWQAPRNWPLWIGLALLLLIVFVAWRGPQLAPHDPVKPVYIVQDPGTLAFVKPPFRPLQMPGYPLGTDVLGRDTFSQILWAIGPTLALVLVAAAVRLWLGLVIGVASGWGAGWIARLLEGATTIAVSIPVLLVALCLVAAFGPQWGVWAFILGLCLTGWAEAARIIHDQTSLIKTQPYVEAASALGASGLSAVLRHVLPHVMPMVWILLPFEISTALLVTAGLGFLGYFVNAIWVPLGDWTAVRASGQPELGQMLASGAAIAQQHPWLLLTAGATIFLIVLAFNLLGEGLRREFDPQRVRRRKGRLGRALERASGHATETILETVAARSGRGGITTAVGVSAMVLLALVSTWVLLRATRPPAMASAILVPGSHLWASGQHDAQGTFWANALGPTQPEIAWTLKDESGFVGSPVVAADGTVYVVAEDGRLYAVNPDGTVRWIAKLPSEPFGAPALNAEGHIYVLDSEGVLYVLGPEADLIWSLRAEADAVPLSSPVVDANGVAYFATERSLIAARPYGVLAWRVNLPTYSYVSPQPILSADGQYLFFEDIILDAASGQTMAEPSDAVLDRYVVGADGKIYLAGQETFAVATVIDGQVQLQPQAQLDMLTLALGFRIPGNIGIAPNGRIWVFYGSGFEYPKLVWTEANGSTLNVVDYPWGGESGRLIALGEDGTAFVCGNNARARGGGMLECSSYLVDRPSATWKLDLEPRGVPVGGALAPGRLYVVTRGGTLYAIQDAPQSTR